jgi:hypothetical protein
MRAAEDRRRPTNIPKCATDATPMSLSGMVRIRELFEANVCAAR